MSQLLIILIIFNINSSTTEATIIFHLYYHIINLYYSTLLLSLLDIYLHILLQSCICEMIVLFLRLRGLRIEIVSSVWLKCLNCQVHSKAVTSIVYWGNTRLGDAFRQNCSVLPLIRSNYISFRNLIPYKQLLDIVSSVFRLSKLCYCLIL